MNFPLKALVCGVLIATSQLAGAADAPAGKSAAAPVSQAAAATPRPVEDWIIYDDATYTPVVDDVSRSLDAARKAFDAKDYAMAAAHMRAVADE